MKISMILGIIATFFGCIMTFLISNISGKNRAIKKELKKVHIYKGKADIADKELDDIIRVVKKLPPTERRERNIDIIKGKK